MLRTQTLFAAVASSLILATADSLVAQSFAFTNGAPSLDRWMYPFNSAPCDRAAGATFGALDGSAEFDTRDAQHLVGWDMAALVPTNRGPTRYLVERCRLRVLINRGQSFNNLFQFDPTQDDHRTYFPTNDAEYLPDGDAGRPMELFGTDYRNGFTTATFTQCSLYGGTTNAELRNAHAAGWSTNGFLVDVSNNVGKTNLLAFPRFEVRPFAIGQTTNTPGDLIQTGAEVIFELNLDDPLVGTYVQQGLNEGRLRFTFTSLHPSQGQFGSPTYPDYVTSFNNFLLPGPRLELDGVAVRDTDADSDGLLDDWEAFYFSNLTNAATGDLDLDGLTNGQEQDAGTDPTAGQSALDASIEIGTGGAIRLEVSHASSRTYELEFTENFVGWTVLTNDPTYDLFAGTIHWKDEASGATNRFYRVVATPSL